MVSPPATPPPPAPAISAVMLNWARPRNVDCIIASWAAGGIVRDAIIWNNRAEHPYWPVPPIPPAASPASPSPPAPGFSLRVINASSDCGLYSRFSAATLASHDCILIQDDDLELPPATLRSLYSAWEADPLVLHGIFGRSPRRDGSYARAVRGSAEVPVVLTRALLTHRSNLAEFFRIAPIFDEIQRDSTPAGNGEDIIFSYVVCNRSGRLNRIHALPKIELDDSNSLNGRDRGGHIAHRSRLMRACVEWLKA